MRKNKQRSNAVSIALHEMMAKKVKPEELRFEIILQTTFLCQAIIYADK